MRPGALRLSPGVLTKARSVGVRNSRLAAAAAVHGLHLLVRVRGQRLQEMVREYAEAILGNRAPGAAEVAAAAGGGGGEGEEGGAAAASGPAERSGEKRHAPADEAPAAATDGGGGGKPQQAPEPTAAAPVNGREADAAEESSPPSTKRPRAFQPLSLGLLHATATQARREAAAAAAARDAAARAAVAAAARVPRPSVRWDAGCDAVFAAVWRLRRSKSCLEEHAAAAASAMTAEGGGGGAAGDQQEKAERRREQLEAKPPKVLADVIESVLAAVFFDSGGDLAAVWRVLEVLVDLELLQRDAEELAATAELRGTRLDNVEV
jgi:hypothetical protein